MNVLTLDRMMLATDGSPQAAVAVDLVRSIPWPPGTAIEVLSVYEPFASGMELPPDALIALDREMREQIDTDLAETRARVADGGRAVDTAMRRGRPATEIVAEADRLRSDLIVMGSRGRGQLATMLLGSVAAEVVDHAHAPVLVARGARMKRLVVADDGSTEAAHAVKLVASWPIFHGLPTRAVSVAPVHAVTGHGPIRHPDAKQSYAEGVDALRGIHGFMADAAAERLSKAGVPARSDTRFGDPAEEIIQAALEHEADVIVMGSRGRTGLERVLLGSVARNVLTHAPVSVLIVREAPDR